MKNRLSYSIKLCFLLLFISLNSNAQVANDSLKPKENKLKFGCGFGLNFVGGTSISLAPNLTYKISDKISAGVGLQGSYNAIKNLQNTTTFGANVLGFYNPIKSIQTSLEFAQLRVNTKTEINSIATSKSFWDSALFVGCGYTIANKISIGAKYNLLYKADESVYTSAIIPFVNIVF